MTPGRSCVAKGKEKRAENQVTWDGFQLSPASKVQNSLQFSCLSQKGRGEWPSELPLKRGGCRMLHPIITREPPLEMGECCQLAKQWGPGVEAPVLSPRLCSGNCVPASPCGPWEFPELPLG